MHLALGVFWRLAFSVMLLAFLSSKYNLVFIFLSNRVCPDGGENGKLSDLSVRSNIMDAVYEALPK